MVGAGSRAATVTFHRVVDTELNTGIFLAGIMFSTLAESVMCYGKLDMGRTDCKDTFPDQGSDVVLQARASDLSPNLVGLLLEIGIIGKTFGFTKQAHSPRFFGDEFTMTHTVVHRTRGYSAWKLWWRQTPSHIQPAQCSRALCVRNPCEASIEEELPNGRRRKDIQHARLWRHLASGERCW